MKLHYEEFLVCPNVQALKRFATSIFSLRFHCPSSHPQEMKQTSGRTVQSLCISPSPDNRAYIQMNTSKQKGTVSPTKTSNLKFIISNEKWQLYPLFSYKISSNNNKWLLLLLLLYRFYRESCRKIYRSCKEKIQRPINSIQPFSHLEQCIRIQFSEQGKAHKEQVPTT